MEASLCLCNPKVGPAGAGEPEDPGWLPSLVGSMWDCSHPGVDRI